MKRVFYTTIAAAVLAGLFSCQPSKEEIKTSADAQMVINKGIDSVFSVLRESYESYHPATMDAALENLNNYLDKASLDMQKIKPLSPSRELSEAVLEKISVMKAIAKNEAVEQVRIYKLPDTSFTDELRRKWDETAKNVEQKIAEADKKVEEAYSEIQKKL